MQPPDLDRLFAQTVPAVEDTWTGQRQKIAILRAVERHHAICFPPADLERRWQRAPLLARIEELRRDVQGNRQRVRARLRAEGRADTGLLVMIAGLGSWVAILVPGWFAVLPLAVACALGGIVLAAKIAALRHYRRLQAQIDAGL